MFNETYEESEFPLAYLITLRTFGTWLHGDERGSIARKGKLADVSVRMDPNVPLEEAMSEEMSQAPVRFTRAQREIVAAAIQEVCQFRGYRLHGSNVRMNHAHVVVAKPTKPEKIVNDLKAYSTRHLRREWQFGSKEKVWSRGASTRYLWKPQHLDGAIDYVLYCQEDLPFEPKG